MAHNRLDKCVYDEALGVSYVSKNNQYGKFEGSAYCDMDDSDIKNKWDGMRIAEFRCDRKIQKAKAKEMTSRAKGIQHAYNVLKNTYGQSNEVVAALGRQAQIAHREAKRETARYHEMRKDGRAYIEGIVNARRKFREKYPATLE